MSYALDHLSGIVTGAAQGIGLSLAQGLLKEGAKVLLNDHDGQALDLAAQQLADWKSNLMIHQGDASDKSQVEEMVNLASDTFGGINMAVANAGITLPGPFLEFPESSLRKMLNLNIAGSFFLAQSAARKMAAEGTQGRILFMSSVTGFRAHHQLEGYGMTKAALNQLARNLAPTLGPRGITVNCIAPGATLTPRTTQVGPQYAEGWSKIIPTGKAASTDDITHTCLFLLSKEAAHINGQTLVIDGGWTTTGPLPKDI